MSTLKLTYFDAPGRAEPIRIALHLAGLPYEDHRVKFPEFMELKQSGAFPLGSVPVLEVDGFTMAQTSSILRYIARTGAPDLYPADPMDAFVVDSALDTFNDTLSNALVPSLFEKDMAKKLEMRAAFAAGPLALACTYAEKLLGRSGGPFLCGDALSIADLVLAQQVLQIRDGRLDGISADTLEPYPRVRALADACGADARIAAYHDR